MSRNAPIPREFRLAMMPLAPADEPLTAMPLVIPDNFVWDAHTRQLAKIHDDTGNQKLVVVPEAAAMLRQLGDEPVAVLCMSGTPKSGKSYVLSRAVGSTTAFAVNHTMENGTHGIWIGTTALRGVAADGKPMTVLLLDTQGIDADTNDLRIFLLSMLLSTLLVFNTISLPRANDPEKLGAFHSLIRHVCIDEHDENMAERRAKLKEMSPSLLWLFRDFALRLPRDYSNVTDYVAKVVLKIDDDVCPSPADLTRRSILGSFTSLEAHTMAPPSDDANFIRSLDSQHTQSLSGTFERDLDALWPLIARMLTARGPTRGLDGTVLSGSLFTALLEQYAAALTPGAVLQLRSCWTEAVH